MLRTNITLSTREHDILRRIAYERRVSIAELIRDAVDQVYGTDHEEILGPGKRRSGKEEAR